MIYFIVAHIIIIPKVLRKINNTTWKTRGILNLIPNEMIKEMRNNREIIEMLK